jgi:NADH-quinone oxidoreductase subunit M
LTDLLVFAGILPGGEFLTKEFFFSLILLATGVFGFFISIDLFTMFLFYELAVIPMYLLIGIWGSGPKEYSAMKLTLMLMGASSLLLLGILGIFSIQLRGGQLSFNILEISSEILMSAQHLFSTTFAGFRSGLIPVSPGRPMVTSAPTVVSMLHKVLMKLAVGVHSGSYFFMPKGPGTIMDLYT